MKEELLEDESLNICQKCREANGKCFSAHKDKTSPEDLHCGCPSFLENEVFLPILSKTEMFADQHKFCNKRLVNLKLDTDNGSLKICYRPHKLVPFSRIGVDLQKKYVRLLIHGMNETPSQSSDRNCVLNPKIASENSSQVSREDLIEYCVSIPMGKTLNDVLPCGISRVNFKNGFILQGLLSYQSSSYKSSKFGDFQVSFQAIINHSGTRLLSVSLEDRTWKYSHDEDRPGEDLESSLVHIDLLTTEKTKLSWSESRFQLIAILDNALTSRSVKSNTWLRIDSCELSPIEDRHSLSFNDRIIATRQSEEVIKLQFCLECLNAAPKMDQEFPKDGINRLALRNNYLDDDGHKKVQISETFSNPQQFANTSQIRLKCNVRVCTNSNFCLTEEDEICQENNDRNYIDEFTFSETVFGISHPFRLVKVSKIISLPKRLDDFNSKLDDESSIKRKTDLHQQSQILDRFQMIILAGITGLLSVICICLFTFLMGRAFKNRHNFRPVTQIDQNKKEPKQDTIKNFNSTGISVLSQNDQYPRSNLKIYSTPITVPFLNNTLKNQRYSDRSWGHMVPPLPNQDSSDKQSLLDEKIWQFQKTKKPEFHELTAYPTKNSREEIVLLPWNYTVKEKILAGNVSSVGQPPEILQDRYFSTVDDYTSEDEFRQNRENDQNGLVMETLETLRKILPTTNQCSNSDTNYQYPYLNKIKSMNFNWTNNLNESSSDSLERPTTEEEGVLKTKVVLDRTITFPNSPSI